MSFHFEGLSYLRRRFLGLSFNEAFSGGHVTTLGVLLGLLDCGDQVTLAGSHAIMAIVGVV